MINQPTGGGAALGRRSRLGVLVASAMAVGLGPCNPLAAAYGGPPMPPSSYDAAATPAPVYGGPPDFEAQRLQQQLLDALADAGPGLDASPADARAPRSAVPSTTRPPVPPYGVPPRPSPNDPSQ